MKQVVATGLPAVSAPIEWAVTADKVLYTAHIPIRPDGSFETGDAALQMDVTMQNLKRTLEAAGGTMADVTQVLIYLTRAEDFAAINEVYARYFEPPYPNRATVVVAGIMVPGVVVEIVAHAHLP